MSENIKAESYIENAVKELIADQPDLFLVEIRIKGDSRNHRVQVFLDGDAGITIDQCAKISRKLGFQLEEDEVFEAKYTLEVSSPGLDMPLQSVRQFRKNIGRELKIKTIDGEKLKGLLEDVSDDEKLLISNEKGEMEQEIINIMEAKVIVSFK